MSKIGTIAILAMAALAKAQDCVPDESQCHGATDEMRIACCDGLACVQKDEWYGQCLPTNYAVPDGWLGTILDYSGGDMTTMDAIDEMTDTGAPLPTEEELGEEVIEELTDTEAPKPVEMVDEDVEIPDEVKQTTGAMAPTGDVESAFMAFTGKDYLPKGIIPKKVKVQDMMPQSVAGNTVLDQQECEDLCTAAEGCNAASFYLDAAPLGGMNCWLKIIANSCELPADADIDANAVLLLKIQEPCTAVLPSMAPIGVALAPQMAEASVTQAPEAVSPRAVPKPISAPLLPRPPAVAPESSGTDSAVSVHGTFLAMAFAGAAMTLL